MDKYNKPKISIVEIETTIITSPSSNNGLIDGGDNESWDSGIVEEFSWRK